MADISTTTGTGHSPKQERHIAKVLYAFIGLAVIVGLVFAFTMAKTNKSMNPYDTAQEHKVAPDSRPANSAPDGSAPANAPTAPPAGSGSDVPAAPAAPAQ